MDGAKDGDYILCLSATTYVDEVPVNKASPWHTSPTKKIHHARLIDT